MNVRRCIAGFTMSVLVLGALIIPSSAASAQQGGGNNSSGEASIPKCVGKHAPGPKRVLGGQAIYDLPYAPPGDSAHRGDLFIPSGPGPYPAVLLLHGGGWTAGDKCWLDSQSMFFMQNGYVAFTANYRLAPKFCYPAPDLDAQAAVRFLRQSAALYKINPVQIGVLGTSAGGQLSMMLGATQGRGSTGAQVAAVASWSGGLDMARVMEERPASVEVQTRGPESACLPAYSKVSDPKVRAALDKMSPIKQKITRNWPPSFIANAIDEFIPLDPAQAMVAKLKSAGVPVQLLTPPTGHATQYTKQAEQPTLDWFNTYVMTYQGSTTPTPTASPSTPRPSSTTSPSASPPSSGGSSGFVPILVVGAAVALGLAGTYWLRRRWARRPRS